MADQNLKSFVERIAKLHEERKAISADITGVVKEAAGVGYIPKTLRKVVARYLADPAKLAEDDALLETYEAALGRVGKALKAVREGSTWQEASAATGVPRATLARAEAVSKRREMIPEEDVERSEGIEPVVIGLEDRSSAIELAPREESSSTTTGATEDEAPATPSVGAVGPSSGRVAPNIPDDDLEFPPFLDRRRQTVSP